MAAPGPIHYGTRGMGFAPETSASKLAVRINPFACKLVFVTASSLFPSRADEGRSLRPETRVHGIVLNQDTVLQPALPISTSRARGLRSSGGVEESCLARRVLEGRSNHCEMEADGV